MLKWIFESDSIQSNKSNVSGKFGIIPSSSDLNITDELWHKLFDISDDDYNLHMNSVRKFFDKLERVPNKITF